MTSEHSHPLTCAACRDLLAPYVADQLGTPERQAVTRHTDGCADCRAELAQERMLADALYAAEVSLPPDTNAAREWARLRARLPEQSTGHRSVAPTPIAHRAEREPLSMRQPPARTETSPATSPATPHHPRAFSPARSLLGGIAAVAVVALVVLGFARVLQLQAQKPHTGTTSRTIISSPPTAIPASAPRIATPISWQNGVLPPGTAGDPSKTILTYTVSPQDGNTAYLCYGQSDPVNQPLSIWVTHDRALHWALASLLPEAGQVSDCELEVDAGDVQRITANVLGQDVTTLATIDRTYLSDDGGAHWTQLPGSMGSLSGLTTAGAVSFANLWSPQSANGTNKTQLVVSQDDFKTWRPIDATLQAYGEVTQFWASPDGSDVLALVYMPQKVTPPALPTSFPTFAGLWETHDTGAHWSQIAIPATHVANLNFAVQSPVMGQPWHICAYGYNTQHLDASAMLIICSTDGGKTWQARPGLAVVSTCSGSSCPQGVTLNTVGSLSITANGDLLTEDVYGPIKNGILEDVKSNYGLFRLKPDASQWDYLGAEPGNAYLYAPAPGAGTLWGYNGGTYGSTTLSGVIGGHISPSVPDELVTASYIP